MQYRNVHELMSINRSCPILKMINENPGVAILTQELSESLVEKLFASLNMNVLRSAIVVLRETAV